MPTKGLWVGNSGTLLTELTNDYCHTPLLEGQLSYLAAGGDTHNFDINLHGAFAPQYAGEPQLNRHCH